MAVIGAIVIFGFIAVFPLWAITMVTHDVFIIYTIAAHGRERCSQLDPPGVADTSHTFA